MDESGAARGASLVSVRPVSTPTSGIDGPWRQTQSITCQVTSLLAPAAIFCILSLYPCISVSPYRSIGVRHPRIHSESRNLA